MFTLPKRNQPITSAAADRANYVSSRFSWIKLRGKKIDYALRVRS